MLKQDLLFFNNKFDSLIKAAGGRTHLTPSLWKCTLCNPQEVSRIDGILIKLRNLSQIKTKVIHVEASLKLKQLY